MHTAFSVWMVNLISKMVNSWNLLWHWHWNVSRFKLFTAKIVFWGNCLDSPIFTQINLLISLRSNLCLITKCLLFCVWGPTDISKEFIGNIFWMNMLMFRWNSYLLLENAYSVKSKMCFHIISLWYTMGCCKNPPLVKED